VGQTPVPASFKLKLMSTAPNSHEARLRRLEDAHKELETPLL
jgi:hypothetical protein